MNIEGPDQTAHPCNLIRAFAGLWGWLGGAKVSCNLHHWGGQLILNYSWARPATLVAGKGRGGMFLFLLFLHFHSCSSFFPVPLFLLLYYLFYVFSPFFWETAQNDPQGLMLNPNSINQPPTPPLPSPLPTHTPSP